MTTHLLDKAFSLIAPHACLACGREGNLLCYECMKHLPEAPSNCYRCHAVSSEYRPCQTCARTSVLTLAFASTSYAEPTAKELVARLKFSFAYQAAETIAALLAERLRAQRHLLPTEYMVTHVPTATTRMRQRGFDHAQLIARQLARELGAPHASLLARTTQQRQVGAGRAARRSSRRPPPGSDRPAASAAQRNKKHHRHGSVGNGGGSGAGNSCAALGMDDVHEVSSGRRSDVKPSTTHCSVKGSCRMRALPISWERLASARQMTEYA